MTAMRFAVSVRRARQMWRRHQVEELLRKTGGEADPMGIGRVLAILASDFSEG
jgi:hypothetical protein